MAISDITSHPAHSDAGHTSAAAINVILFRTKIKITLVSLLVGTLIGSKVLILLITVINAVVGLALRSGGKLMMTVLFASLTNFLITLLSSVAIKIVGIFINKLHVFVIRYTGPRLCIFILGSILHTKSLILC